MTELWNNGMAKPTESPTAALRFVVETVLALGILMRATSHVVFVAHQLHRRGKTPGMDVTYRLQPGFAVRSPSLSWSRELQIRLYTCAIGLVVGAAWLHRIELSEPLAAIAVANWGYLTADPLWFAADQRLNGG